MSENKKNKRNPWAWIPSLYFAEGVPYVVVMTAAVIMFKRLGISNTDIALYTGWLYLPWVIKPFWSPLVDLLKTKRWWIIAMQLVIGAAFGGIALALPLPIFFKGSLIFMWLLAFSSATHDIAADGFYMLALNEHQQSYFVGIRSTFYRVATITGQGILIIIAGSLESWTGLSPVEINITSNNDITNEIVLPAMPNITEFSENDKLTFVVSSENIQISPQNITTHQFDSIKNIIESHNIEAGFVLSTTDTDKTQEEKDETDGWWTHNISKPLGAWLKKTFNSQTKDTDEKTLVGNIAVAGIKLNRKPEENKEIVLNIQLKKDNDIRLVSGERLVFNSKNFDKLAYVLVQIDNKAITADDVLKGTSGNIQLAWSILFFILSGLFIALFIYHRFILPHSENDKSVSGSGPKIIFKEFFITFGTFFTKKHILLIISFLLLYRLGESQIVKMASPFLLDTRTTGGLGLTTGQLGLIYGTIGLLMLTIGGILGGLAASNKGLKYWLWPMALGINIPHLVYVYLSYAQPNNLFIVGSCVAFEQFCYGFAFTAYMLYMLYVCESSGVHKTAHYAICTGFMALGMMIPGMLSGWLQECIGYQNFFVWVILCAIPGLLPVLFVKVDPKFGIKGKE
ncbi:MAG: MFS transporter [Prevotellaceae bacterium]|jgi:PAT family beta-lactamase induction signal transducer AmpG|nr:MFS transporter [Prevotellaceae bacterium]